jgi:hypothetical protein
LGAKARTGIYLPQPQVMCSNPVRMPSPATLRTGLAEWLTLIIEGLREALGVRAEKDLSVAPLMLLAWSRLGELSGRFARLFAAFQQGRLAAGHTGPFGGRRKREKHEAGDSSLPSRLPSKFGWLVEAAPESAEFIPEMQAWLEHPDLPSLLAEAPQAERLLNPLCRMLGIKPHPAMIEARAEQESARRERKAEWARMIEAGDWEGLTGLPPLDSSFWSPENLPPMVMPPMIMPPMVWPSDEAQADPMLALLEPGFFQEE